MKENEELTAERSLQIIRDSIERSRKETTRQLGKHLLMWGVLLLITSIAIGWLLWQTNNENWNYLWFVFGISGGAGEVIFSRRAEERVKNFTSDVVANIWIAFAIFCFCTFLIALLSLLIRMWMGISDLPFVLQPAPMIIIMEALCATIMGLVLRNVWITATAIVSGLLFTAFVIAVPDVRIMIVLALAAVFHLIVPGLIIVIGNKKQ